MLKENDFKWLVKWANNIPENPIVCEYCIVDNGDGTGKMYVVQPVYAQDTQGVVRKQGGYKYFVFFDCSVRRASPDEFTYSWASYSGYLITSESFIAVFDNMEDAKKRAYTQYAHSFGYVLPHIVEDTEEITRKHFIVSVSEEC